MSDLLTFMMGEFAAQFPQDRQFARNHMWSQPVESGGDRYRFGFTAYAVRLLQDVYFLDWLVEPPANLKSGQEMGSIESKKAESSLYSPGTGELLAFNDTLLDDPSAINSDKYDQGWLFEMQVTEPEWLSPSEYLDLLEEVWPKTQRTIKGQVQ